MGVRRLTTYVNDHKLLEQHKLLQGTKLVIDGNSFFHFLYHTYKIPNKCGGQYRDFAEKCATFFTSLARRKVKPFVVLDGANPSDDSKQKTSESRAQDRIQSVIDSLDPHNSSYKEILPIMTHGQFCCSLTSLGVPHITSEFEADRLAVSLAVSWNCPVLTNDSDFFIFNIPAGVIPLNEEFKMSQTDGISCQIFHHEKLCTLVLGEKRKSRDLIVMFATLLGNDFVSKEDLKDFLDQIPKPWVQQRMKMRNLQFEYIKLWLRSTVSLADAKTKILRKISKDKQTKVSRLVDASTHSYSNFPTNSELAFAHHCADYFDNHNRQHEIPLLDVQTKARKRLPEFFLRSVREGRISSVVLNILINRRVFLPCQVEDIGERSSYCCSRRIRKILYGVLLSIDDDTLSTKDISVEEWTRTRYFFSKSVKVAPFWNVGSRKVIRLSSVHSTSREKKHEFLMKAVSCKMSSYVGKFPLPVQFLIGVIQHWIIHSSPPVNKQHVHAVLLAMMKLGALRTDLSDMSSIPHNWSDERFDISAVHAFAQFQACFQAARDLRAVLLLPETILEPQHVFSGSMMCGLFHSLTDNPDCCETFLAGPGYQLFKAISFEECMKKNKKKKFYCLRT